MIASTIVYALILPTLLLVPKHLIATSDGQTHSRSRPVASIASIYRFTVAKGLLWQFWDSLQLPTRCQRNSARIRFIRRERNCVATEACARLQGLALRRHNLEGGQHFDADPGQMFGAV